jgi:hypothetical protein
MNRQLVYEPPSAKVIDQYARKVCQQLGQTVDPSYDSDEMVREFGNFMKIVTCICAKYRNKGQKLPSHE